MSLGGSEYPLRYGPYTAVVTEVGGGLRLLRHRERDLVLAYRADQVRPRYRGALLAPWPNRVVDGRYRFGGTDHQLALTEPGRRHALHGLVTFERFEPLRSEEDAVTLVHRLVPRPGYPFRVDVTVGYRLDDRGLTTSVHAHNLGDTPAPYGVGAHPYLLAGPGRLDDWVLALPAQRVLQVTPDRLVPTGLVDVAGTLLDFRTPRRVGTVEADHAFTGLVPAPDGLVRVGLTGPDGGGVECRWNPEALPWVQVHTADLPPPAESRAGLAVEPMTCAPDAFNSGRGLVVLEPGHGHTAAWTIAAM